MKSLFDVYTWNEQGRWDYARTIEALSKKQAHYLANRVYGYPWGSVSITDHKPQDAQAIHPAQFSPYSNFSKK